RLAVNLLDEVSLLSAGARQLRGSGTPYRWRVGARAPTWRDSSRCPGRDSLPAMRVLAVFLALSLAAYGLAQRTVTGAVRGGFTYVEASSLAVALGHVVTADAATLPWRGAEGVVTFFAGSSEALLQHPGDGGPQEWSLGAPVLFEPAGQGAAPGAA